MKYTSAAGRQRQSEGARERGSGKMQGTSKLGKPKWPGR